MSEENISLESLKNPEKSVSFEVEEVHEIEETHLEYKKRLNKKVSDFTDEEKAHYNKLQIQLITMITEPYILKHLVFQQLLNLNVIQLLIQIIKKKLGKCL